MAFTNRDRLRKRLKAIPVEARRAVRKQLKENAQELAEMQRRLVPVDTMALHDSIRWKDVSNTTRIAVRNMAGGKNAIHARWVEFGTSDHEAQAPRKYRRSGKMTKAVAEHHGSAAQPFFWPSYRALKKKMKRKANAAGMKAIREAMKK